MRKFPHISAWFCMVLHGCAWLCMVLHGLFIFFWVFFLPSFFSRLVYRFCRFPSLGVLALEGGTLLLLLSCLLLSWCWVALVIVPPLKVYLCYRAALIVTFQLLGFFFPAQLDPDL